MSIRIGKRDLISFNSIVIAVFMTLMLAFGVVIAQEDEEFELIDSSVCSDCHETNNDGTAYIEDLSHSVHEGLECLDCHVERNTAPHRKLTEKFHPGRQGCRTCHEEAARQYQSHGRSEISDGGDIPHCSDCHGSHDILPSSVKRSSTHPTNLPATCGKCHEDLDLTRKHDILIDHPIQIYETSVHGKATKGGVYVAASCNDCHSTGGTAHRILSPGFPDSAINHFNIPKTCGQCHKGVESDFWEGIHGQLVKRGETDAPVCTDCHGEHGILSPDDPLSPVSRFKVAESTCSPCHESEVLNAKYGLQAGRLTTFIDSYHGLKSKAGDTHVANCASCHGVHRILPSKDPLSTINMANLRKTCGDCHPGISEKMANMPIHGNSGDGLRTPLADLIEDLYIILIALVIGGMVIHWLFDLWRQLRNVITKRPQIVRMRMDEVFQHAFLAISFIVLVLSGFSLVYDQGFIARIFFGWEGGFQMRGLVHRIAAVMIIITSIWHLFYLTSKRGRIFIKDMLPVKRDFEFLVKRFLYNVGFGKQPGCMQRFSYVEKAEYWALMWGNIVMVITGLLLWFDNWFIQFLPKGVLDVALVVHFWEAWLASLAILVWHMYATVFSPHVYPMNPSWLTGTMPEEMYAHEHPGYLEEARRDTEELMLHHLEKIRMRENLPDFSIAPKSEAIDEFKDTTSQKDESDKT